MTSPRTFSVSNTITVTATITPPDGNVVIQVARTPNVSDTITISESRTISIPVFNAWNPENMILWRAKRRDQFGNIQVSFITPPNAYNLFVSDVITATDTSTIGQVTPLFIDISGAAVVAALIAHGIGGASAGDPKHATTGNLTTTGADLLIVFVSFYDSSTRGTISDAINGVGTANVWNALTESALAASVVGKIFWSKPTSVGALHTFTYTSVDDSFAEIMAAAFSGSHTTPFDVQNGATGAAIPSGTIQTGTVTPSVSGEIMGTGVGVNNTGTISIDSSFTITDQAPFSPGNHFGGAFAYKIKSNATAENPTWSGDTLGDYATRIATFKPAPSGDAFVVTDTVTIRIPTLVPSVSDTITFTESVTMFRTSNNASASETVTLTETVTIAVVAPNTITIGPSITNNTITITDTPTIILFNRLIDAVSDTATVTDTPTLALGGATQTFLVSDTVTFGETIALAVFIANVSPSTSDIIQVIETVTMFEPHLDISLSETVTFSTQPFLSISTPGTTLTIGPPALDQNILVTDSVTISVPTLKPRTVSESIMFLENIDIRLSTIGFTVTDSFGVQEEVHLEIVPGEAEVGAAVVTVGPTGEEGLTFLQRLQRRLGEDETP